MKRNATNPVAKRAIARSRAAGFLYFSETNSQETSIGKGYEASDGTIYLVVGDRACYVDPDDPRPDYWHVVAIDKDGRTRRASHPMTHPLETFGYENEETARRYAEGRARGEQVIG